MTRLKYILIFIFLRSAVWACECPQTTLSRHECDKYDLIFKGRIKAVKACSENSNGSAVFEVDELYKGSAGKEFRVLFECNVSCAQPFLQGDEWIIYTTYRHMNDAKMDWCSRSRKYFKIENQDFYKVNFGNDYEEELKFLRDSLGLHRLLKDSDVSLDERNKKPDKTQFVILLLVSLAGMILFYWLFKKYFRF